MTLWDTWSSGRRGVSVRLEFVLSSTPPVSFEYDQERRRGDVVERDVVERAPNRQGRGERDTQLSTRGAGRAAGTHHGIRAALLSHCLGSLQRAAAQLTGGEAWFMRERAEHSGVMRELHPSCKTQVYGTMQALYLAQVCSLKDTHITLWHPPPRGQHHLLVARAAARGVQPVLLAR